MSRLFDRTGPQSVGTAADKSLKVGKYGPWTRVSFWTPVFTVRVGTRAIAGVLLVENNYDVINNNAYRSRWRVFTGVSKNDAVFTARVHRPWARRHFGHQWTQPVLTPTIHWSPTRPVWVSLF